MNLCTCHASLLSCARHGRSIRVPFAQECTSVVASPRTVCRSARTVGVFTLGLLQCLASITARAQVLNRALARSSDLIAQRSDSALDLARIYNAVDRANPSVRAAQALSRATAARVPGATRPQRPERWLADAWLIGSIGSRCTFSRWL